MANWPPMPMESRPLRDIFDPRVDRSAGPDACWLWTGAKTKGGYGHIIRHGREFLVHRLALYFDGVSLERTQNALHSCDNPPCCNPKHLRAGSAKDNAQDRVARKRRTYAVGEANPSAKLDADSVRRIRREIAVGFTQVDVAAHYGVSPSLVRAIVKRQVWAHLDGGAG